MSNNADLIAEARETAAWFERMTNNSLREWLTESFRELADALEATEKRATEAEAEVVRLRSQRASHG